MQVRTLFLSDIHLGYRRARVRELLEFLSGIETECIVLAGDILDLLSLSRQVFWSSEHTAVVRELLARQEAGTRLIYVPGNHDAELGVAGDWLAGRIEVHREWVHRTARDERLLVVHGDGFDGVVNSPGWLTRVGSVAYDLALACNDGLNELRRLAGRPYWSLAERLKLGIGVSAGYIERFEAAAAEHARTRGLDGIICGHIHRPRMARIGEVVYCNTGDWVESCSAIIEDMHGTLRLWRWAGAAQTRLAEPGLLADPA